MINGILGIVSAGFIIWSAVMSNDWGVIFQQVAYIVALDIPVLLSKSWMGDKPISHGLNLKGLAVLLVTFAVGFGSLYAFMAYFGDPKVIYDGVLFGIPRIVYNAGLFGISLTASVLCLLKYRAQHVFWLATSVFAILTWASSYMAGDASLVLVVGSLIYMANDFIALTLTDWWAPYRFNINYYRNKKKGITLDKKA